MAADPRVHLNDILHAIAGTREALGDADFATYRQRRPMRRAVEREIEIISEASRRVPGKLKAAEPDIPWHQIAGIGNVCGTTTRSCPIRSSGTWCMSICRRSRPPSDAC